MSNLIPFQFESFNVRTLVETGEVWVVAKDVAEALGYKWQPNLIGHVPEKWKGINRISTPGGNQEMSVLSEQGLYFFLGRSDKPKALPFQMWLAGEVVPSIRKQGYYEAPQPTQPKPQSNRPVSVIAKHERLAKAMITMSGVRPGIATAIMLANIELETGIDTESYRRLIPGETENIEALNATAIGKLVGVSAREVNQRLAALGLQERSERGEWALTEKGQTHGKAYPYARNGHAGHQIMWQSSVTKLLGH